MTQASKDQEAVFFQTSRLQNAVRVLGRLKTPRVDWMGIPELVAHPHGERSGIFPLPDRSKRARLFDSILRDLERRAGGGDQRRALAEQIEGFPSPIEIKVDVGKTLQNERDRVVVLGGTQDLKRLLRIADLA